VAFDSGRVDPTVRGSAALDLVSYAAPTLSLERDSAYTVEVEWRVGDHEDRCIRHRVAILFERSYPIEWKDSLGVGR
jgi:hypothetical protein